MKILIINPNSNEEYTKKMEKEAQEWAGDDFEVHAVCTPGAPKFIDYYTDEVAAAPGMIQIVKDNEAEYDAFIISCTQDPNVDALRQVTNKPVIGGCESSIKIASMLGHSFSVLSGRHSAANKEAVIRKFNMQSSCASVRCPDKDEYDTPEEAADAMMEACRKAVEEDLAEVIVNHGGVNAEEATKRFGVPVINALVCSMIIASGLAKAGYSTSKVRRYKDYE